MQSLQELPPGSEVHLSPQVARSDVSSVAPDEYSVLSNFSHAVLNDTGWYRTVGVPARLLWGLGRDQSFLVLPPTRNNSATSVRSPSTLSSVNPRMRFLGCLLLRSQPIRMSCGPILIQPERYSHSNNG